MGVLMMNCCLNALVRNFLLELQSSLEKMNKEVDVAIIGGGPAGLAAAISARKNGAENILVIERNESLGGILNQCIHEGFGIELFKEALSGPEYIQRFIDELIRLDIPYVLSSSVVSVDSGRGVKVCSPQGFFNVQAKSIVLAMGCRERTRGSVGIPGERPAGVYTAGCAQNLINLKDRMVGKRVVILGSGDIGLIMARRLTLEGAKVLCVSEILPYSSGLPRNIVQCLEDYDIPLHLNHTVIDVRGEQRVEGLTIAQVDDYWKPIRGTEKNFDCDCLLLSVGLIPENELSKGAGVNLNPVTSGPVVDDSLQTNVPGIFACGNVLHVHDLVDWVSREGELAGRFAAEFARGLRSAESSVEVSAGEGVRYVLPQRISMQKDILLSLRVFLPSRDKRIIVTDGKKTIKEMRKLRVSPSEMIQIHVKKEELDGISQLTVMIE